MRDDIRLLGRILGDTIRTQEGPPVFAIVEQIRRTSIRFHREEDEAARGELEAILNGLSRDQNIQIIRAFSYFSHLANIAEDQHHIRRTRAHAIAAIAPLKGAVVANGMVKVEGNRKSVQHLEGGIIKELRVKEGDRVNAGDVVIVLDESQARAEFEVLTQDLIVLRATEERLRAEMAHRPKMILPGDLKRL